MLKFVVHIFLQQYICEKIKAKKRSKTIVKFKSCKEDIVNPSLNNEFNTYIKK